MIKTVCPECKGHLELHSDMIFEKRFLFGDCNECSYLGVWNSDDHEWKDSTPYWVYIKKLTGAPTPV